MNQLTKHQTSYPTKGTVHLDFTSRHQCATEQQKHQSLYSNLYLSHPPFSTPLSSLSLSHTHISSLSLSHTLSLSLSLSLYHMSNYLSVKLTGCLIPHGNRQRERKRMRRGGIGDQRDYKHCGRSQICLLNNSDEEQRVKKKNTHAILQSLTFTFT